jgi:hypothetical protein
MLAWSTLWQTLSTFASFPLDAIPHFGTAHSITDVFRRQAEAFKCLAGHNIDPTFCPTCDCPSAAFNVTMLILCYVLASFFLLGVVKYGNATFSFIVGTVSTPLSEFAFSSRLLMGGQAETISPYNYGALVALLIGVVLYRIFDTKETHSTSKVT